MTVNDHLIRVVCAQRLVNALNETSNLLGGYHNQLHTEPARSLALSLADQMIQNPIRDPSRMLAIELSHLSDYLRTPLTDAEQQAIQHQVTDEVFRILANSQTEQRLAQYPKDGRTPVGFLADFAEAAYRKHHQDSLANVAIAGLLHYGHGVMVGVTYPMYMKALEQLINLLPDPAGRSRARSLFQFLAEPEAVEPS